jgi:5-methyltetrahydropteroyltriglutamate--homocysteine methyltransferase
MKRSSESRILTTHTGSLPRPEPLEQLMFTKLEGEAYDEQELRSLVRDAVAEVVQKQAEAGVDVVCDGEMSREGMQYVRDHMEGFAGESKPFRGRDVIEFPDAGFLMFQRVEGVAHMKTPACTGAIKYRDLDWLQTEIADFRAALAGVDVEEAFMTVTSPGTVAQLIENEHYESREAYLTALADAVKVQADAIVDAGFLVQMDACDLPMQFHVDFQDVSRQEAHALLEANVEAINRSLADVPADRIRLHVCWGNYPGPHVHDVPMDEILDLILACKARAISFPAANPRHEHEWRAWENVDLPDGTILIPGVIDTISPFVEHPKVVADRIQRFADVVGPENVMASTDCGFGTFVGWSVVAKSVCWAKLAALAEGAKLASGALV